jgi:hypothetical protein
VTTPARSGPEGSLRDKASSVSGNQEFNRLLRELLADLEPLSWSQCHVAGAKLFSLFAVDRSPLRLVTGGEQGSLRASPHDLYSIAHFGGYLELGAALSAGHPPRRRWWGTPRRSRRSCRSRWKARRTSSRTAAKRSRAWLSCCRATASPSISSARRSSASTGSRAARSRQSPTPPSRPSNWHSRRTPTRPRCAPQPLQGPTTGDADRIPRAQNGAVVDQSTEITVTGCPKKATHKARGKPYRGGIRSAPSNRMTSPLSMGFTMM